MNVFRRIIMALCLLLMVGVLFSLASCGTGEPEEKDITGVQFNSAEVFYDGEEKSLEVTGNIPEGVTVSYTGDKAVTPGEYNFVATLEGEGYKTLTLNAKLTIKTGVIDGVTLESCTYTYDGTAKSLVVSGALPSGVLVEYENNGQTDAGSYIVKARVYGNYYNEVNLTSVMIIEKADIQGVGFASESFTFDGDWKSVLIGGTLPEGVSVTYDNNIGMDAGTYIATATLTGANYNTKTLTATLTIEPAKITGITFEGATHEYDGSRKRIEITGTLPEGVTVSYTGNEGSAVGNYPATAVISGANYQTLTLNATLTITEPTPLPKQDITGVTLTDGEFTYDGSKKSIAVEGNIPTGVTVDYKVIGDPINVGSYPVVAILTGEGYNELVLQANIIINKATLSGISFEGKEVSYTGEQIELLVSGALPSGVSVAYSGNKGTNVGEYNATAVISGANYNTLTLTATLKINKANITGITLENKTVTFNYSQHFLAVSGTLPEGVVATYDNNGKVYAGTYTVTVTITGDNYNTLVLTATLTIKHTSTGGITLPEHEFNKG